MLSSLATIAAFVAVAHGAATGLPSRTTAADAALCSQYAYQSVNGYDLLNNLWGISTATSGSQCTTYDGPAGSGIAFSSTWTWQGDQNTVKSYIYAGRQFQRKKVSDIRSLPTTVEWSYNRTDHRANVAYDIFTSTDPDHANSSGDFELMIWLHRYGGIWPITSSSTGSPIATVTVAGYSWDLYTGYNGAMRVYSFVAPNGPYNSFTADVKEFFNYLVKNESFPESQQYMLIYQFGTEAFVGGPIKFGVSKFQAEVN
ncbi:concanavalin A-like lectin/glucanase domain-containing protein [Parachaetomium inaequale]|uniref:Concanavalin A-like lectin/glucanase domain-containing protein n=1 Tax=Parachaetomium inaequale TaxID=2588326 RepID=A0AAN6SSW3_9PEZI|nr:concanavalin A-like lectin/glucanase domain-containing protein [Parachaetomium inaequale]